MIAGKYFVSPHAVQQFQRRMAWNLSYEQALGEIIKGIKYGKCSEKPNHTGATIIRVRGEWNFRAVVKDEVIVTILKSGKGCKNAKNHGRKEAENNPLNRERQNNPGNSNRIKNLS